VLLAAAGFLVVAVLRVPWHWLPAGEQLPRLDEHTYFSAAELRRTEAYSSTQSLLSLLSYAVSLVVTAVLGLTGLGARLLSRTPGWWWLRLTLGTLVLLVIGELVTLPFSLALRRRAVAAGLTRQSLAGWGRDEGVSLLVTAVYTAIAAIVLVGLARRLPRTWPAWGALISGLLVVIGSFVYPVVVEPLFNSFRPLPAGALRTEILQLARTEHVQLDDVLVSDASIRTTELNAYVTGFGSTRRVVLWDNTVRDLPRSQVAAVVAHELGHAEHDDVLLGTVLGAFGAAFGVGLLGLLLAPGGALLRRSGASGPGDPRVLALLLALTALGGFVASPVENAVSRSIEARADRTGLEATRDPTAFVAMQRRLALSGLDEPQPPAVTHWWFGTHPTTMQRIGMAEVLLNRS
ncbi:M48 family metalloprotease, partial [Nocardioides mangrovicus]|uniref:M48 family metalloprotease n=1 Tax=Nocardioides mangrovicus TaxID=2478913 RepID=UPI002FCCC83D